MKQKKDDDFVEEIDIAEIIFEAYNNMPADRKAEAIGKILVQKENQFCESLTEEQKEEYKNLSNVHTLEQIENEKRLVKFCLDFIRKIYG